MRQSAKRERIPDLLEIDEFQLLQAELGIRERILVWLDMTLGLSGAVNWPGSDGRIFTSRS